MVFKKDWETANNLSMPGRDFLSSLVRYAFSGQTIVACEPCKSGCANLNIRVRVQGRKQPWIVRVYLRQPSVLVTETRVGQSLKSLLPVPEVRRRGSFRGHDFVVMPCLPGVLLRDALETADQREVSQLMEACGNILGVISRQTVQGVSVREDMGLVDFGRGCLGEEKVKNLLGPSLPERLSRHLEQGSGLLAVAESPPYGLVHGDFDPANILVEKKAGGWQVSGILDWEFSFAGSCLWDVSNMLRYAFEMPPSFQDSFVAGLEETRGALPESYEKIISLLNMLSLLDLLRRTDPGKAPLRCRDILRLLTRFACQN